MTAVIPPSLPVHQQSVHQQPRGWSRLKRRRNARSDARSAAGGRHTWLTAGAGVAIVLAMTAGAPAGASVPSVASAPHGMLSSPDRPHLLSPIALGLNTAPWDYVYAANVSAGGGLDTIQPLLQGAGMGLLRYGGGSYADYYDWQTNTDIQTCIWGNPFGSFKGAPFPYDTTAPFTGASCDNTDSLGFDQFASQVKAIGAQSFVTVNYGSGTPDEAAAWVAHARAMQGDGVALWEVGNENYGCWEVNNWLAQPPASFQGYKPNDYSVINGVYENPTCPQVTQGNAAGTQTLATSYAVNARPFLAAMRQADPTADIGVPWAFGSNVSGASVPNNSEWNDTVLGQDGHYVSFVDAHYYPFFFSGATGGSNPTDQQVLRSLMSVPSLYDEIRAELDARAPWARIVVGETGVSNNETTTVCTPTGALFAAGDALSWLAAGAQSVDWWDMNNYGNTGSACTNPDYGMFTSGSPPATETPYYGYVLASALARPHALLATMATSNPTDVLAYQSHLPGGQQVVAFINTNTSSAQTVTFDPRVPLSGQLTTLTYSAADQNATNSLIVKGTASANSLADGITLPAESMVVLESN